MAALNVRLIAGGVYDVCHDMTSGWGIVLRGSARLRVRLPEKTAFPDDLEVGDMWSVPSGYSCEIQGLSPDGVEFLFLRDMPDAGYGDTIGDGMRLRPFPAGSTSERDASGPFVHCADTSAPVETPWGCIRIVDSEGFPACDRFSVAVVEIRPGAMRDLHWHPNGAEWFYVLDGAGRMTIYEPDTRRHVFDCRSGDVGHVPFGCGHFMENPGDTPLRFLEVFLSDHYADVSLTQWLALEPVRLVAAHLNLAPCFVERLARLQRP